MKRLLVAAALGVAAAAGAGPADRAGRAGPPIVASPADRAYAQVLQLLHGGREAEAYGRAIELANAGHADAARLALTMCRYGRQYYGRDWDCSTDELDEWARLAGVPQPQPQPQPQPRPRWR